MPIMVRLRNPPTSQWHIFSYFDQYLSHNKKIMGSLLIFICCDDLLKVKTQQHSHVIYLTNSIFKKNNWTLLDKISMLQISTVSACHLVLYSFPSKSHPFILTIWPLRKFEFALLNYIQNGHQSLSFFLSFLIFISLKEATHFHW